MLPTALLLFAQATSGLSDADIASAYADREMASYTAQPAIANPSCVRKFRRLKVPRISIDILIDLDDSGAVSAARIDDQNHDEALGQCLLAWIRTVKFRDDSPRRGTYVSTLINASLLPPPPKYAQYEAEDSAIIENWGSAFTLCKLSGLPAKDGRYACAAYTAVIDGQVAKWHAKTNRIVPGTHQLNLACSIQRFTGTGFPIPTLLSQTHTFTLQAGGSYKLAPRWDGDLCLVDIIDQKSGLSIEKRPLSKPQDASNP